MFAVVLSLVGFLGWAGSNVGTHVEPRWEWVTTDPRYEHLLEALDAHAPDLRETEAIAATLQSVLTLLYYIMRANQSRD